MALDNINILSYLQINGIDNNTVSKICEYVNINKIYINSDKDLLDLYNKCKDLKLFNCRSISILDIENGIYKANIINEKCIKKNVNFISKFDNLYPQNLLNIKKNGRDVSPLIIYYKGNITNIINRPAVAIIGTREILPEAQITGERVSKIFSENGFNIVSGLAIGCDTSAHIGALESKNGTTTAFLAHGLDTVYPKQNTRLVQNILDNNGVIISEYPVGAVLRKEYLIERDRLQSGLADATVVIQTGIKGGTMHAVKSTIENGKSLYVIKYKNKEMMLHEKVIGNTYLVDNKNAIELTSKNINTEILKIKNEKSKTNN